MKSKKKLLVLGVAINNYAVAAHRLSGCHNDLVEFVEVMQEHYAKDEYTLQIATLRNEEARRERLIECFLSHFDQLEDGDTGVFYFSGHGSQAHAPEVFWEDIPSHLHETLVCYDSRIEGGRDLYDKELGYLIWKVTHEKDVHFTVITDCCHSGSITKDLSLPDTSLSSTVRMTANSEAKVPIDEYLGVEAYEERGDQLIAPVGRHILLSACRGVEKARERTINYRCRGVFTYSLMAAIRASNGQLNYGELMDRTKAKVFNISVDQHPQLQSYYHDNPRQLAFLGGKLQKRKSVFLLSYDKDQNGWIFNQGLLHGVPVVNKDQPHTIRLVEPIEIINDQSTRIYKELEIKEVRNSYSTVDVPEGIKKNVQIPVVIKQLFIPKMIVTFSKDSDLEGINLFQEEWNAAASQYISLEEDSDKAQYLIQAKGKKYQVIEQVFHRSYPVFFPLNGYSEKTANRLFQNLELIAQWHHLQSINNPYTQMRDDNLRLQFYNVTETSRDFKKVVKEEEVLDFLSNTPQLRYRFIKDTNSTDDEWLEPHFRLHLLNPLSNHQVLWVSVLYMGSDYFISNELLPLQRLAPGEGCWLTSFEDEYPKNHIALHLQNAYWKQGISRITEHFKIFIGTDEMDTHVFNQNGLPLEADLAGSKKGLHRKARAKSIDAMDWRVIDFTVEVIKEKSEDELAKV